MRDGSTQNQQLHPLFAEILNNQFRTRVNLAPVVHLDVGGEQPEDAFRPYPVVHPYYFGSSVPACDSRGDGQRDLYSSNKPDVTCPACRAVLGRYA